jgi:hypothetical protein
MSEPKKDKKKSKDGEADSTPTKDKKPAEEDKKKVVEEAVEELSESDDEADETPADKVGFVEISEKKPDKFKTRYAILNGGSLFIYKDAQVRDCIMYYCEKSHRAVWISCVNSAVVFCVVFFMSTHLCFIYITMRGIRQGFAFVHLVCTSYFDASMVWGSVAGLRFNNRHRMVLTVFVIGNACRMLSRLRQESG